MTKPFGMLVSIAAAMLLSTSVGAHHAFGGEFDANRPILLRGTVTRVQWVNPHVWIHIEITKDDGTTEEWMVEGGSPNTLTRIGVTAESVAVGTELVIDGYQARDPTLLRANGRNITYPDGTQLLLGSSRRNTDR